MGNVHILTNSACQIPPSLCQELEIHVVPLPMVWEGRTYLDDEIEPREYFAKLRTAKVLPKTSGPTPGAFKEEFERLGADGKPILAVLMGKDFSSTFNAATLAKDMSRNGNVTLFNSYSLSMGLGFQVLAAARAARAGKDLAEILSILTRLRSATGIVFALRNIDYIWRGGRIGHLQRFVAHALNLIPIMEVRGGPIRPIERVRNEKNIMPRLLDLASERLKDARPRRVAVLHVDAQAQAWQLAKEVRVRLNPDELITSELSPVIATHAGPDAIALAYSSGV